MVAKAGLKRKVKEGEKEKEGVKEAEEEFQTAYSEVEKEVVELVSSRIAYRASSPAFKKLAGLFHVPSDTER